MGKKKHYVNVKLDDEEKKILEDLKEAFSENTSDAIRRALRFARALCVLPIQDVIKPVMLDQLLKDEDFRRKATLVDVIKEIPQLEREVKKWVRANEL